MDQPLVSIVVITYNSAKTVIETLDSIKEQAYKNIELIISDDASQDGTVDICRKWLMINKEWFLSSDILTVEKNSGIPANCNRGVKLTKGEWIKLIAGDDLLKPNCISTFINYIDLHRKAELNFLIGKIELFNEEGVFSVWPNFNFPQSNRQQFMHQIFGGFVKAPGVFMRKKCLESLGWFDEKYRYFEDDPLWYKYLSMGYSFTYIDAVAVKYRTGHQSASNGNPKYGGMSNDFYLTYKHFKYDLIISLFKKYEIKAAILLLLDISLQRLSYSSHFMVAKQARKYHSKIKTAQKLLINKSI